MTSPSNSPHASLAQTYSRVRAGHTVRSGIRRSLRLGTICLLASFSILIGSSLFTFGMSYPVNRYKEPFKSAIVNYNGTNEAIQSHSHGKEIDESYDIYSSLPRTMMQSLFVSSRPLGMVQGNPCAGRCLDPHPGEFRYWYGQQNGCWIQVWRAWPEGCQHYQWYNSCNGSWDSYPNGAPRVYWNCCVH